MDIRGRKKSEEFFKTDHLNESLQGRSIRGGSLMLVAQGLKLIMQLGSTAILGRLLAPADFGLLAMVTAVTGFILMFKDMGLSMATVQRAEISHQQVSNLFWINFAISIVIMLMTLGMAPILSHFYSEPRIVKIAQILSIGMVMGGLTVQHQALLRRQMKFSALVLIDLSSQLAGVVVAVLCAYAACGYWSLVAMHLTVAAVMMSGVWIACRWRPGLPQKRVGTRSLIVFGGNMTGYSILNYFSRTLDNVLIGWMWGPQSLGFYSRAYSLLLLPIGQFISPLSGVVFPVLSRLQNEPEQYKDYYLGVVKVLAYVTMPCIALMFIFSNELILVFLGDQWIESARIFKVLAFTAFLQPVYCTAGWVYVSLGRADKMAQWGLISSTLILLSFVIGVPWGAYGVAVAYTICMTVLFVPNFVCAFRSSPVRLGTFFRMLSKPTLLSLVFVSALSLAYERIVVDNDFIHATLVVFVGILIFAVTAIVVRPIRVDLSASLYLFMSAFINRKNR